VRAALASDRAPQYERVARGSVADAFEARIRVLLAGWPRMPAPVIADRIGSCVPQLSGGSGHGIWVLSWRYRHSLMGSACV
jgi:hypothetical protein